MGWTKAARQEQGQRVRILNLLCLAVFVAVFIPTERSWLAAGISCVVWIPAILVSIRAERTFRESAEPTEEQREAYRGLKRIDSLLLWTGIPIFGLMALLYELGSDGIALVQLPGSVFLLVLAVLAVLGQLREKRFCAMLDDDHGPATSTCLDGAPTAPADAVR